LLEMTTFLYLFILQTDFILINSVNGF
jgi:hypothetical protein